MGPVMHYVSICAIVKDEDKDVREWLHYHFATGFEHALIFDNNSRVPLKKVLADFIAGGLVTIEDFPLKCAQQLSAYMSALKYWGKNTRWLAFIDVDEFIVPLEKDDIRDFLDDYIQYAGVGANWAMFASGGHVKRPAGGIIENYTACLGLNPHIKSIVQPAMTQIAKSAHHFTYRQDNFCVNEDGIPIHGFVSYPVAHKLKINHYYYKSQDDFKEKVARGLATQMKSGNTRSMNDFYSHLDKPTYEDRAILRFAPALYRYAHMSAAEVSTIIQEDREIDIEREAAEIEALLVMGDEQSACRKARTIARYHDWPGRDPFLLQAPPSSQSKSLEIIKARLQRRALPEEHLVQSYQALAALYRQNGSADKAGAIERWLKAPMDTQFARAP